MPSVVHNILALDIGDKRIGVAIASADAPFPAPLLTLETGDTLLEDFNNLLKYHKASALVVGLPRNQSGEETGQSDRVRKIVSLLRVPSHIPVFWQDESLTSVKAEEELSRRKKPYTKADIDSLAATYILDDFIQGGGVELVKGGSANESSATQVNAKTQDQRPARSRKKFFLWIAISAILTLVLSLLGLIVWYDQALKPLTADEVFQQVKIEHGSGTTMIAQQLEEENVIRSARAFVWHIRINKIKNLQAGDYHIASNKSVPDIVKILTNGDVATDSVTISPGQRLDQVFATLNKKGFSDSELQAAISSDEVLNHPLIRRLPSGYRLEGYLFPDTYQITPTTTAKEFIKVVLDNFLKNIEEDESIISGISKQGLSLRQAIIIASIVQQEVSDYDTQRTVAQVFLKRYREGIELGSDVTSLYGATIDGVSLPKNSAQAAAIAINHQSPYNTRQVAGLPPSAIANFNISALRAVANPTEGSYLYFVAGDNGETYFSSTADEHEYNVQMYCQKLCG